MSSLDDAKDFVAKHEDQLDPALGKPSGQLEEPDDESYADENARGADTDTPEARDL